MNVLSRRLLLLSSAAFSTAIAIVVIYTAGLPLRLDYASYLTHSGELLVAPEIGARAPQFDLPLLSGPRLRLADLSGSPVVLNFWATWCAPCRVEMPALQRLYEDYHEAGLRVLGINHGETAPAVRRWRDTLELEFDLLLDTSQVTAALYRVRGYPTTYVVSPAGVITHVFYGPISADSLRAALAPFLTSPSEDAL
ncbi:MAG: TlpA family protein disulfide reductase [Aggregatilineales bacterium]